MAKRSLYLPDELMDETLAAAEASGRTFANFVQWALRRELGSAQSGAADGPSPSSKRAPGPVRQKAASSAASTRAPAADPRAVPGVVSGRELLMRQRQAKLNETKK